MTRESWHPSPGRVAPSVQPASAIRHIAAINWRIDRLFGEDFVVLKCPRCGVESGVGVGRCKMNPDGTMLRRFRCAAGGCSFHDFVKLMGWRGAPQEATG